MKTDAAATRIRAMRMAAQPALSQQALADRAGIERWKIANIESGRRRVSSYDVAVIAQALGTDPNGLLGVAAPTRMYRAKDTESPAIQDAMGRFEEFVETSLRLDALRRFYEPA